MGDRDLEIKALEGFDLLYFGLVDAGTIENILSAYSRSCKESLSHLDITERNFDDGDMSITIFEIFCFTTFLITQISKFYIEKYYQKIDSIENAVEVFNNNIIDTLNEFFIVNDIYPVTEKVVIAITPQIKFGDGANLSAKDRISEYCSLSSSGEGREAERFGKNLGKALDAKHYPIFEIIGGCFMLDLIEMVKTILSGLFTDA